MTRGMELAGQRALPRAYGRLDSLTGLRALAAFAVFMLHAEALLPAPSGVSWLIGQGNVGVLFFFILSGFVMAWSWRDGDGARGFYRRRVARIIPAYLVAAFLALPLIVLEGGAVAHGLKDAVPSFTLLQAWVPNWEVYFGGNGVLWTLSVEACFYLIFPVIIGGLRRLSHAAQVGAAVGLLLAETVWRTVLDALPSSTVTGWAANVLPVAHLPEFVAGSLLALLVRAGGLRGVQLRWAAPLAVAAYLGQGFEQLVPLVLVPFALVIVAAANADLEGTGRGPLRARWLVQLGVWSYAFYLLHQLVIRAVVLVAFDGRPRGTVAGWVATALALGLAVAAAAILFVLVERPLDRRLRGDGRAPTRG